MTILKRLRLKATCRKKMVILRRRTLIEPMKIEVTLRKSSLR